MGLGLKKREANIDVLKVWLAYTQLSWAFTIQYVPISGFFCWKDSFSSTTTNLEGRWSEKNLEVYAQTIVWSAITLQMYRTFV